MAEDDDDLGTDPAAAFESLRAEVADVKVSVERAAKQSAAPDYTPTLAAIAQSLAAMEAHPALKLTPEQHRQAVAQAGGGLMREAVQTLERAGQGVERERQQLASLIGAARAQDQQFRALCWAAGVALATGLILSPFVAGIIPFGLNTRVAALVMRNDRWTAGAALMQDANPAGWRNLVDSANFVQANQDALTACRQAAAKGKVKAQRCVVKVSPPP